MDHAGTTTFVIRSCAHRNCRFHSAAALAALAIALVAWPDRCRDACIRRKAEPPPNQQPCPVDAAGTSPMRSGRNVIRPIK